MSEMCTTAETFAAGPPLTGRQRLVLHYVVQYYRTTGEPCSARYLGRRLEMHHSSVQRHFETLHRKGWLRSSNSPVTPVRW
jgi:DNA-binding MarR family transcriptional regulator